MTVILFSSMAATAAFHMPAGSTVRSRFFSRSPFLDITNGMFTNNSQGNVIENVKIDQRYIGSKWQLYEWNGFKHEL